MKLTLNRIESVRSDPKRPLRVHFTSRGQQYVIDVSGAELQSFPRFQATVLERCGVLVRHIVGDRPWVTAGQRREAWLDDVQAALRKGRKESAA